MFCSTIQVEVAPRRKSIATTYTGMAAAIADAMKARRMRLTESFVCECWHCLFHYIKYNDVILCSFKQTLCCL